MTIWKGLCEMTSIVLRVHFSQKQVMFLKLYVLKTFLDGNQLENKTMLFKQGSIV